MEGRHIEREFGRNVTNSINSRKSTASKSPPPMSSLISNDSQQSFFRNKKNEEEKSEDYNINNLQSSHKRRIRENVNNNNNNNEITEFYKRQRLEEVTRVCINTPVLLNKENNNNNNNNEKYEQMCDKPEEIKDEKNNSRDNSIECCFDEDLEVLKGSNSVCRDLLNAVVCSDAAVMNELCYSYDNNNNGLDSFLPPTPPIIPILFNIPNTI